MQNNEVLTNASDHLRNGDEVEVVSENSYGPKPVSGKVVRRLKGRVIFEPYDTNLPRTALYEGGVARDGYVEPFSVVVTKAKAKRVPATDTTGRKLRGNPWS